MVAVLSCAVSMSCLFAQETNRSREKAKQINQALSRTGRQTFESTCASCHGLDGKGGERGPDIATRPEVVRLSDEEISRILRTGIPRSGMPPFAALGSAKLSAVLNHLRFLQGKGSAQTLPGNAMKGKELFEGRAGCSECHMVQGFGGFLGPDLSNYGASHSVSDIRGAIVSANKRPGTRKALAKATTRDGRTVSGLVRNEDNFSLQLQSVDGALHFLMRSDLAELTFGSKPLMPEDYATRLSETELDQVVAYLLSIANSRQEPGAVSSKARKKPSNEE
jgi:putative heme-binding domain-containing protein